MNATATKPILQTADLNAGYREGKHTKTVIKDASLELHHGRLTCLLGANGAGKSTLLRTIGGQQPTLSGSILINGNPLQTISRRDKSRTMSMVYTERTLTGALTVSETVALGRQPYTGYFGRLSETDTHIVNESLDMVGMSDFADRYMGTLSDGERQKAMIARALAQQTPVMILDEPTSFLDVASRLEVMALLDKLAAEAGKAILLSTHDVANALSVATDLWLVMPDGHVTAGPARQLVTSPEMDRVFTGRHIGFDTEAMDYRLKSLKKSAGNAI